MPEKVNYPKKYGYRYQEKYAAEHYKSVTIKLPLESKSELDSIAQDRGVTVNQLIREAILQTYGINCSQKNKK